MNSFQMTSNNGEYDKKDILIHLGLCERKKGITITKKYSGAPIFTEIIQLVIFHNSTEKYVGKLKVHTTEKDKNTSQTINANKILKASKKKGRLPQKE